MLDLSVHGLCIVEGCRKTSTNYADAIDSITITFIPPKQVFKYLKKDTSKLQRNLFSPDVSAPGKSLCGTNCEF